MDQKNVRVMVMDYGLWTEDYELRTADYGLWIMD